MKRLAAMLLLTILGHGLLMTSAAAAPQCSLRTAPIAAPSPVVHCADHEADCFTVQGVVKAAPIALHLDGVAVSAPAVLPSLIAVIETAPAPPGRPPDVARALLQVYRN